MHTSKERGRQVGWCGPNAGSERSALVLLPPYCPLSAQNVLAVSVCVCKPRLGKGCPIRGEADSRVVALKPLSTRPGFDVVQRLEHDSVPAGLRLPL